MTLIDGAVISIVAVFLGFAFSGWEAWPFSSYRMYAFRKDPDRVRFYRLALRTRENEWVWWRPAFHNYQRGFGYRYRAIVREAAVHPRRALAQLEDLLRDVARLLCLEEESERYESLVVVLRRVTPPSAYLQINDQPVLEVPLALVSGEPYHG